MESLDTLAGVADDANPVSAHLASEGAAALSVEKKLDLVIWYMREVHAHCYYTSTKLWWPWQAQRRPPAPEPPPAEPAEAEPEAPAADGDDAPAAEAAEDSADKPKAAADGDGSDDGEVMEDKPKEEAPKPAESRKRKQHERHKGPGKFGDRLGLGHDVHGLSLSWHDNLDRRSKKFVAAAAAFKAQTQSEEEFLAQYEEKYEAAVVEFCKDNSKEQKSEDGETQWRCLLPPNKLFRYDAPPPPPPFLLLVLLLFLLVHLAGLTVVAGLTAVLVCADRLSSWRSIFATSRPTSSRRSPSASARPWCAAKHVLARAAPPAAPPAAGGASGAGAPARPRRCPLWSRPSHRPLTRLRRWGGRRRLIVSWLTAAVRCRSRQAKAIDVAAAPAAGAAAG